jgi:anaerobic selenocysteine-containing dehydrogenase
VLPESEAQVSKIPVGSLAELPRCPGCRAFFRPSFHAAVHPQQNSIEHKTQCPFCGHRYAVDVKRLPESVVQILGQFAFDVELAETDFPANEVPVRQSLVIMIEACGSEADGYIGSSR